MVINDDIDELTEEQVETSLKNIDNKVKVEKRKNVAKDIVTSGTVATIVTVLAGTGTPTLFGSPFLGGLASSAGILAVATPPGLLVAATGAAITFGVCKYMRKSGKDTLELEKLAEEIRRILKDIKEKNASILADRLRESLKEKLICRDFALNLANQVLNGEITASKAIDLLNKKINSENSD